MTEFESALDGIGKLQNSLLEKVFEQYMEVFKELEKENTDGNINYIIGDEKQNTKQKDSVTYNAKESDTVTILKPVENTEKDKPLEKDDENVDDEYMLYAINSKGVLSKEKMSPCQKEMFDAIKNNRHNIFLTYRSCGVSTLLANIVAKDFCDIIRFEKPRVIFYTPSKLLCEDFFETFWKVFSENVPECKKNETYKKALKNFFFRLCSSREQFRKCMIGLSNPDYVIVDNAAFCDFKEELSFLVNEHPNAKIIVASCFGGELQTTDKCNDFTSLYFDTLCGYNDFDLIATDVIKDYREGFNKHFIDDYMFSDCLPNNEKKVGLLNIPNLDCSENEFKTKWIKKHYLQ